MGFCLVCGAVLAGLAVSSGRPLGIVAPSFCQRSRWARNRDGNPTRLPRCTTARRFGRSFPVPITSSDPDVSVLLAILLWTASAALLALPWTLVWCSDERQALWRAAAGILLSVIPPLGIIGWASPVLAARNSFPGQGWYGLFFCTLATGTLAVWPRWTTVAIIAGPYRESGASGKSPPPTGWVAVNTEFGSIAHHAPGPLVQYQAALQIQQEATSGLQPSSSSLKPWCPIGPRLPTLSGTRRSRPARAWRDHHCRWHGFRCASPIAPA